MTFRREPSPRTAPPAERLRTAFAAASCINLSKRTQLYAGASYANGHDLLDGVDRFNQVFASGGLTYRF